VDEKEKRELESVVLDTLVSSLQAQLRAVERLRENLPRARKKSKSAGASSPRSQLDLVEEALARASAPLHIDQILERIEKAHGVTLDRESIVSALSKKVHRGERFVRTDKNTFALLTE
jgi:lipoate-protein ligase A